MVLVFGYRLVMAVVLFCSWLVVLVEFGVCLLYYVLCGVGII